MNQVNVIKIVLEIDRKCSFLPPGIVKSLSLSGNCGGKTLTNVDIFS